MSSRDKPVDLNEYRKRRGATSPKVVQLTPKVAPARKLATVNLGKMFRGEPVITDPDVSLDAKMEMIRDRINALEDDPVRNQRTSRESVDIAKAILEARYSLPGLIKLVQDCKQADWERLPNRYLAVIELIKEKRPPTTKS